MATMIGNLINHETFQKMMADQLNDGMREAAEPVIAKALEEIERTMRKQLASMVVALVDRSIQIDRQGENLRIVVLHEPNG